jgi:hypothetical protein
VTAPVDIEACVRVATGGRGRYTRRGPAAKRPRSAGCRGARVDRGTATAYVMSHPATPGQAARLTFCSTAAGWPC